MTRSTCFTLLVLAIVFAATLTGCKSPKGYTVTEQRESVQQMRADALDVLYADRPDAKAKIADAPGYAVFSNFGMKILIAGSGNGFGVVHDKAANADTYMKMLELNVGLGIGIKNYRVIFVFHNAAAMKKFINEGWTFGGDAQAAAKISHDGGEAAATGSLSDVEVFILTKTGIDVSATIDGTKFWRDDELNASPAVPSGSPTKTAGGSSAKGG